MLISTILGEEKHMFYDYYAKALPFGNVSPIIMGLTLFVYFQVL